ncbi:GldG family protein [Thiorhodococcus mannitoliphagus]|uniref:GldG family protein n=1 Tax=Thiorhodococcus mannitoliphagus TaxID=329406 RepID=A0A6P1DQ48_9GAMM|nr:Gldg family protein [Thiorhodococcus mannitoliphagus]NEX18786.1 GldG family protein [Thiorhodococcus mannitoliphagus]
MKEFLDQLRDRLRRLERPLADALFALLLLALVITSGWLVARHDRYWDWTRSAANTLVPQSRVILERLEAPLRVTVFADAQAPLAKAIGRLLARYTQALPDMEILYRDPQLFPEQARDADVSLLGQILLEYRGRRETLKEISERSISAAIARLMERRSPWIAVIEGHGERAIKGERGPDLGRLGNALTEQGFLARPLDLARVPDVPDNTRLVILSNPQLPLFAGEVDGLMRFLDRGGNLLWLMDPGALNGLEPLAELMGVKALPGVVVDAAAARFGAATPAVAVISDYPSHPLTEGLSKPALLPGALAFDPSIAPSWNLATFLATGDKSWNETGAVFGKIGRDEIVGELPGPLPVALALTRSLPESDEVQRVVVVGDGDFLSNSQIGSYGNSALGIQLLRWLSTDEDLIELPPEPGAVEGLEMTAGRRTLVGVWSLIILPAIFLVGGLLMRWYRWRGQ